MITLRPAAPSDQVFLEWGGGPSVAVKVARQIATGRLQIIEKDGEPIGFIKTCVLWETLPFMEVIRLEGAHRRRGHGTAAVRRWEEDLATRGFAVALISTQAGTAHEFWRKIGYVDCGALQLPGKPEEIFMQRALRSAAAELVD